MRLLHFLPVLIFFHLTHTSEGQEVRTPSVLDIRAEASNSILGHAANADNLRKLLEMIRASELDDILGNAGPFTLFAPSDEAFEKHNGQKVASMMNHGNKDMLYAVMAYHIVAGKLTASTILKAMCRGGGKAVFTTVQGDQLMATMDGIDIVLTASSGNTAKITVADADQSNGVIHQIDRVILPKQI